MFHSSGWKIEGILFQVYQKQQGLQIKRKLKKKGHLEVPEMFHMTRNNGLLFYSLTPLKKS